MPNISLKSDWNHLLINFFDPNLSSESEIDSSGSEIHGKAQIQLKEIENISKVIEFDRKC